MKIIILVLALLLFAGCVTLPAPDKCDPGGLGATKETLAILSSFCDGTEARLDLYEQQTVEPFHGVWCLKKKYVVNNTIIQEEILIGTLATPRGALFTDTITAVELTGPYGTCAGRL